jgi:hypothetical protein
VVTKEEDARLLQAAGVKRPVVLTDDRDGGALMEVYHSVRVPCQAQTFDVGSGS